jgi:heme-degrading monooxygenase HmoA
MRATLLALLVGCLAAPLTAERDFDIDGPVELHIWMTAKNGHADALAKTFTEVFYPAVSSMPGFRSALLMRKPSTGEFTVRLSFDTEDQRMEWVASDKHQRAWPALSSHSQKTDYDGFAVIHPK